MNSIYSFIVSPKKKRYNNEIKIGDKTLITNSNVEDHNLVSKQAVIISVPLMYKGDIKIGDEVMIHHNIFRRWYDQRGNQRNSSQYFREDLYFCNIDQIYLYKNNSEWKALDDRCFVKPIKDTNELSADIERKHVGILKIGNSLLETLEISTGDLIGFKPGREWEFIIDDERLYCMKSNNIVIKYEYQGNEEEYNPSWARSC